MAILYEIAVWPLVCLIVAFALCAIYYCVKIELKNRRKIGASKNEEAEEESVSVVVKKISGKIRISVLIKKKLSMKIVLFQVEAATFTVRMR